MKRCPRCFQKRDQLNANGFCHECERERARVYYLQHKESSTDSYIERHEARRQEEAEIQESLMSLETPTVEQKGSTSASNWNGLVNGFLRPKTKESRWAIR